MPRILHSLARFGYVIVIAVATVFPLTSGAAAQSPTSASPVIPSADSIGGRWKTGGSVAHGTKYIILDLTQHGDSLSGTAVVERDGMPTDTGVEVVGTFKGGQLELHSPFGEIRMAGNLRRGSLRVRVVPGRYQEANAYETTFTRLY